MDILPFYVRIFAPPENGVMDDQPDGKIDGLLHI